MDVLRDVGDQMDEGNLSVNRRERDEWNQLEAMKDDWNLSDDLRDEGNLSGNRREKDEWNQLDAMKDEEYCLDVDDEMEVPVKEGDEMDATGVSKDEDHETDVLRV